MDISNEHSEHKTLPKDPFLRAQKCIYDKTSKSKAKGHDKEAHHTGWCDPTAIMHSIRQTIDYDMHLSVL